MTICESVGITFFFASLYYLIYQMIFQVIFQDYDEHKKFGKQEHATQTSFKTFIEWYSLNPEEWHISCCNGLPYRLERSGLVKVIFRYVMFNSYSEWKKYMKWLAQQEKAKEQQEQLQSEAALMRIVLNDIEKIREKAEKEMAEANKILEGVNGNA